VWIQLVIMIQVYQVKHMTNPDVTRSYAHINSIDRISIVIKMIIYKIRLKIFIRQFEL